MEKIVEAFEKAQKTKALGGAVSWVVVAVAVAYVAVNANIQITIGG